MDAKWSCILKEEQGSITKEIGICGGRCSVWVVAAVAGGPPDKERRKGISCHNSAMRTLDMSNHISPY